MQLGDRHGQQPARGVGEGAGFGQQRRQEASFKYLVYATLCSASPRCAAPRLRGGTASQSAAALSEHRSPGCPGQLKQV